MEGKCVARSLVYLQFAGLRIKQYSCHQGEIPFIYVPTVEDCFLIFVEPVHIALVKGSCIRFLVGPSWVDFHKKISKCSKANSIHQLENAQYVPPARARGGKKTRLFQTLVNDKAYRSLPVHVSPLDERDAQQTCVHNRISPRVAVPSPRRKDLTYPRFAFGGRIRLQVSYNGVREKKEVRKILAKRSLHFLLDTDYIKRFLF